MTDKTVQAFLSSVPTPTRPLGELLPSLAIPPATSPWSPRTVVEPPPGPSPEEIAALTAEAREAGRAAGLAETAALRERLAALLADLTEALAALVAPSAELVADAASCVVETWLEQTHRSALFAPVVRSWLALAPDEPATVRVHPDDEAAMVEAIGDASLAVVTDPRATPGALEIRSATRELVHDWAARLPELRTALVAALTGMET